VTKETIVQKTGRRDVRRVGVAALLAGCLILPSAAHALWNDETKAFGYHETFGLDAKRTRYPVKVTLTESNAAGNVFHHGEQPTFTFQIENLTDAPIQAAGKVEVIHYGGRSRPDSMWIPEFYRIATLGAVPIRVNLAAKGFQDLTVQPATPETKGGYALVVDLGAHGRLLLTNYVRTYNVATKRVQFPKQSLENMPPEVLRRLGVQAIRYGIAYTASSDPRYAERLAWLDEQLKALHAAKVVCTAEIGATGFRDVQPLGRARPHLDANGVTLGGKTDMAWLPKYDDDYERFVYLLAAKYGWPKGPINGFMLWNEPWEGLSISGWGADMLRYRTLYKRMGDAVFRARKDAGVDVLIGGCDSSTNTWDKLFPEGIERSPFWPEYLDFCSIHYQGLGSPCLYPEWVRRKHYKGRVLIWDTESWVANTDDKFVGVVATNRACGYDRSMGIRGGSVTTVLSHHRVAHDRIRTAEGTRRIVRPIKCWPVAAVVGAVQHFIGERAFREILFRTGLPWVYVFDGLDGKADDGTVVVLGDVASLFGRKGAQALFGTVRCLDEVKAGRGERREMTGATLTIPAGGGAFGLYDFYGNRVEARGGRIVVPLNAKGYFLRADPARRGSFRELLAALRTARIDGLEPLDTIAYDMTAPLAARPVVRLRLTSTLNRPVEGRLSVTLGRLKVEYPRVLRFGPRERKWVDAKVVGGKPAASNTYPLALRFDAGADGLAVHHEDMHVNVIHRRTVTVDGRLDEWKGALPQTVATDAAAIRSFEEQMWLPFAKSKPGAAGGFATGYLAYDAKGFYFAAKIADDTPHPGGPRFARRDHDADFYPAVCYSLDKQNRRVEHVWPEGVRRFSYRRWPALPSGYGRHSIDNVLIAFNAIPLGEDGWLSHLPGRMPKFVTFKSTDYQYALNPVAPPFGGGTEIWRLEAPGMPRKHFYPRQPRHAREGAVESGRLAVRYEAGWRIVECAIPWPELPHVKQLLDAGKTVKFSFAVHHDGGGPTLQLAMHRSAAEGLSRSFHPDWQEHWPNEIEFGFEK